MGDIDCKALAKKAFPALRWSGDAREAIAELPGGNALQVVENGPERVTLFIYDRQNELDSFDATAKPDRVRQAGRKLLAAERRRARAECRRWERAYDKALGRKA